MRNTLILAASFLTLAAFQTIAAPLQPCGAVKHCHYDPWENSDDTSERDGGGKVSQSAGDHARRAAERE